MHQTKKGHGAAQEGDLIMGRKRWKDSSAKEPNLRRGTQAAAAAAATLGPSKSGGSVLCQWPVPLIGCAMHAFVSHCTSRPG